MQFHGAISDHEESEVAADEVVESTLRALGDDRADALFVFFTAHHRELAGDLLESLQGALSPDALVGCSAEGVIGAEREIERAPGLSIMAVRAPGVRFFPFHVSQSDWDRLIESPEFFANEMGCGEETRAVVGFGDPFSTPMQKFLPALTEQCPRVPLIGGMASAGRSAGKNVLMMNEELFTEGFVGVSVSGAVGVETVVSQGCRPVGKPFVITRAKSNLIEQLGGKPAAQVLRNLVHELPEVEQALLANGLYVGRAVSEYRDQFRPGDFLVRNIIGLDEETSALSVGDYVRTGQTVQFFARDARTASEDLSLMLEPQRSRPAAAGGLLFSCNGRGTRLFAKPGHDLMTTRAAMPGTPIAGFFAAGEFGPVGGENFVHGQTASLALIRPT